MHPAYTTPDTDDPPDELHEPPTEGEWELEPQPDGSTWILGPDPQDGEPVLVAACEMERDARHIRDLHNHALQRIQELDDEREALGRALYDLKTHVENTPIDAFRYPDTVNDLLDLADTLLDGQMPDLVERKRELEAENERLREALQRVIDVGPEALDENIGAGLGGKIRRICKDALEGGGEHA